MSCGQMLSPGMKISGILGSSRTTILYVDVEFILFPENLDDQEIDGTDTDPYVVAERCSCMDIQSGDE